jgi:hypothetical protein
MVGGVASCRIVKVIFKNFAWIEKKFYFCSPLKKALVAQLDRASDYGSEG